MPDASIIIAIIMTLIACIVGILYACKLRDTKILKHDTKALNNIIDSYKSENADLKATIDTYVESEAKAKEQLELIAHKQSVRYHKLEDLYVDSTNTLHDVMTQISQLKSNSKVISGVKVLYSDWSDRDEKYHKELVDFISELHTKD